MFFLLHHLLRSSSLHRQQYIRFYKYIFHIYRMPCFFSSLKQIAICYHYPFYHTVWMACKMDDVLQQCFKIAFWNSDVKRIKMDEWKKKHIIKFFGCMYEEHWCCSYGFVSVWASRKWASSKLNSENGKTLRKLLIQKLFIVQCRRHISSSFFLSSSSSHLICFESVSSHLTSSYLDCLPYIRKM